MNIYNKKLEDYLQNGVDYLANTISNAEIEDLQQLISDSYFQGWNDALSERQSSTKVSENHDSKTLHIADVSHSYNFSINYDELYDLVVNKDEIIFCKLLDKMDEISSFDYTVIRKRRDNSIMCGVRGLTYFDVYDWSIEHNSDCKTMKDVFAKYCKMLKLEFVSPNCG